MLLYALWSAHNANAEHTADHRYRIWGYVKNANGAPLEDIPVAVADRQGSRLKVARSDANGRYSMQLHLHNKDLGRLLNVEANSVSHQIQVVFDPDNTTRTRTHRVDFIGSQAVETLQPARSFTTYILLAIGACVVIIPAFLYFTGHTKRTGRGKEGARRRRGSKQEPARRQRREKK